MAKTSEARRNAVRSLSAKVTESTYDAVLYAAGEKKPGVWLRELIEAHLARRAFDPQPLMEEVWAIRHLVINGLKVVVTSSDREAVALSIDTIKDVADQRKAEKARALLRGERP